MPELRATILGCGSSGGVPRLGGHWGNCDPENPKNHRRRCSLLLERFDAGGTTRVLIDTTPDLRAQLLDAGVGVLDGVAYTHPHADHIHGIDDLRMVVFNRKSRLPVWADAETANELVERFTYAFVQPEGSAYPPILDLFRIEGEVVVEGDGGAITLEPFEVRHGAIKALGFRIGPLAYLPDVSDMDDAVFGRLEGLECWILDALQYRPHPTHINLETAVAWIERSGAKRGVLTNMHIPLDYETVAAETPPHIDPAFDGMVLSYRL